MKNKITLLATATALLTFTQAAQATLIDWDSGGGADTEWSNADNWETTYVPGNNGVVDRADFFQGSDTATVTSNVSSPDLVDIKLRNNGNITISADMSSLRNIDIGIDGAAGGFGTFIKQSAGTVNASNVVIGTDDTNGGLYEVSGTGSTVLTGNVLVGANGKFSMIGNTASASVGGAFTMATTAILDFEFDASGVGTIATTGAFTVDGTDSALSLDLSGFLGTGSFDLMTFGSIAGNFDAGNITGLDSLVGVDRTATIGYDSDSMFVTIAVPEPGTYALLAGLTGLVYVMVRRRRA